MENIATSPAVAVSPAVEEATIRPRQLRANTKRPPRMSWEVSLAEQANLPRPPDGSAYFPYYLYGTVVKLKNGMAVL